MRAAVISGNGAAPVLQDFPEPTAQDGAVLDQGGSNTHAGGSHGSTHTGQASANDHQLIMSFYRSHVMI